MPIRPIHFYSNFGAKIEIFLMKLTGYFLRPLNYRFIGSISKYVFANTPFNFSNYVVIAIFNRSKFYVYLDDYYWSRLVFSDFVYEPEVARVLASYLNPKCVFLDLGANVGFWSVFASEVITDPDKILAVEAGAASFERLRRNASINSDSFTIIRAAVTERDGETVSFITETKSGHAAAHVECVKTQERNHKKIEKVTTTNIDALMKRLDSKEVDHILIKLDVEGMEVEALKGAAETLRSKNVLLIYEDISSEGIVTRYVIEELGFDVYIVKKNGPAKKASVEEIVLSRANDITLNNFIAVPRGEVIKLN